MSRKAANRVARQGLYRAFCSFEPLEVRTLLSTATISAGTTVRAVPSDLLGVNTAPWDGLLNSGTTLSLSQAAGIDAVRIGGGSTADTWHFNSTSNSESIGEMADYVANLNATGVVTVNYGTGSPQEGVALWAYLDGSPSDTYSIGSGEQWNGSAWVSVNWGTVGQWATLRAGTTVSSSSLGANHAASFNIQDFEIGNEIYGSWETDEHGTGGDTLPMPAGDSPKAHDPTTLISFAKQFQTEINAILSDGSESGAKPISIGVDSQSVATAGGNSFSDWIGGILTQSVDQGFVLGYIADHYYAESPGSESDATLLGISNTPTGTGSSSNSYDWAQRATVYDNLIHAAEVAGGAAGVTALGNTQLIADEVNSVSSSPGKQSTSLVNGLFIADAIGSAMETTGSNGYGGYEGVWLWDLHNGEPSPDGNTSSSLYGWRQYGDYGIIGNGSGARTNETSPDYYALQLLSKIVGSGGTIVSASEDNESAIDTFAVLEPDGHLDLLVINKTNPGTTPPSNTNPPSITEQFNISGFTAGSTATIWQYGVNQDDAQANSPTFASSLAESTTNLSVTSGDFSYAVPDYSMTVIDLTPSVKPTVAQAAAANPNPVTGTSTSLTVLGSENGSDTGLTYTWSYTGPTGVTYTGNTNGTNAAKSITANFTQAGTYNFTATITDPNNLSTTSSISVTVNQTPTTIIVSPGTSPVVPIGFTQQFSASATDQFGSAISSPGFTWGITGTGNSIDGTGDVTLGSTPGSFTVSATDGSVQGSATVIAEDFAVPNGSTLDINLSSVGPVSISSTGNNITASQNGVQITLSGFTGITVTDTGSGDVLNFNGPVALPIAFTNTGTSTINVNSGALTFAPNQGGNINLGSLNIANGASAAITAATTDTPTTLILNSISIGSTGYFDVTNNKVLINYATGSDPISSIAGWIATGYASSAWNGFGIISTTAQSNSNYALGYADAADANNPAGLPANQIEILYTLVGDANLDGAVNSIDFAILSSNFNKADVGPSQWDQGDFNYDGSVNSIDFAALSSNFNKGSQIAVAAAVLNETDTTASTSSTIVSAVASLHHQKGVTKSLRSVRRKS